MRRIQLVIALLAGLTIAGCDSVVPGSPTGSQPSTSAPYHDLAVGELVQTWTQFDDDLNTAVLDYTSEHAPRILLRDQDEYDAWADDIPDEMAVAAEDITLADQVAIVGYYTKCMEQSAVFHLGGGELRYDVWTAPEDEGTLCDASPLHVELWVIDLEDLDVDAADVELIT
ncbi:hypothetical protein [Cumulibacter soli]|uniref:hypothetical protein n=1 Tax=Cumulibacter soli TaxID=2546344 RepID=UPI001068A684|nr:hypothetical protein [Cumulibacter soli]